MAPEKYLGDLMLLSSNEIAYVVLKAGFQDEEAIIMTAIILEETAGNTDYLSREKRTLSDDSEVFDEVHGLARISLVLHSDKLNNWRNPYQNLAMARKIYQSGKFTNWDSFLLTTYKRWLSIANIAVENPLKPVTTESLLGTISNTLEAILDELQTAATSNARIEEKHLALIEQQLSTIAQSTIELRKHFK